MICASTVDAEIKPSSALTESRGGWKPGRKRRGKWTAEGKVNGTKCALYPDRMPALKAGNVMAFPIERIKQGFPWFINKGGTARRFSRPVL